MQLGRMRSCSPLLLVQPDAATPATACVAAPVLHTRELPSMADAAPVHLPPDIALHLQATLPCGEREEVLVIQLWAACQGAPTASLQQAQRLLPAPKVAPPVDMLWHPHTLSQQPATAADGLSLFPSTVPDVAAESKEAFRDSVGGGGGATGVAGVAGADAPLHCMCEDANWEAYAAVPDASGSSAGTQMLVLRSKVAAAPPWEAHFLLVAQAVVSWRSLAQHGSLGEVVPQRLDLHRVATPQTAASQAPRPPAAFAVVGQLEADFQVTTRQT
jgi:hypothetical protein